MDQHIEHILNQIPGWNAANATWLPSLVVLPIRIIA